MSQSDTTTPNTTDETKPENEATPQPDTLPEADDNGQDNRVNEQIELLKQEAQKNLDGWQRARAEFLNYKKRTDRELNDRYQRASLDTLEKLLPVIDDFERAVENIPEDLQENSWVSGTALILKKLQKLLEDYDVEVLDPVGETFDPNFHEAVGMTQSDEYESGQVAETLQKGYISGERVLRAALVRVAS